ncbi:NOB1 family endonuclease [Halomarina oriensis]|uniref:DNA-binding protein n=1 Tax=Halomarina oriensis TaxID=671145 RepID=A0A6B0GG77_9EURY|nr:DNA-binding protein [Halomarina oriensis]MWG33704.1 DNA-binding protein [Halomarina oriensis]
MRVLDSSAFIRGYDADGPTASVPRVREELNEESSLRFDAEAGAGMTVHAPSPGSVRTVENAAERSGDARELSETDYHLVAAAFELDATLVTDDYAMQNVASRLDVPVETIGRDGIEEEREWRWQCSGCGRTFDDDEGRCPVCGSDLSRKR